MNKTDILKSIGYNIQLARRKKGFMQEILAEKCNVSTKYISALEIGCSSGSIPLIINICNILEITPNYIFDKALNLKKFSDHIEVIDTESLVYFDKLKDENKEFICNTIKHSHIMQNKR